MLPLMDEPEFGYEFILGGVFQILKAVPYTSWEMKEKMLQGFYHGLKGTCSKWVAIELRGTGGMH